MMSVHPEYVVDQTGQKTAVLLPYKQWKKIIEDLEELDDIRLYDKARSMKSEPIQFDEALEEIEQGSGG